MHIEKGIEWNIDKNVGMLLEKKFLTMSLSYFCDKDVLVQWTEW